jgi:hypothetical protein
LSVEWSRRELDDPALSVRFDANTAVFGFESNKDDARGRRARRRKGVYSKVTTDLSRSLSSARATCDGPGLTAGLGFVFRSPGDEKTDRARATGRGKARNVLKSSAGQRSGPDRRCARREFFTNGNFSCFALSP